MTQHFTTRGDVGALFMPAVRSPWREVMRQRWGATQDLALVLREAGGQFQVMWPQGRQAGSAPRAFGGYDAAWYVQVTEQPGALPIRLPDEHGPPLPVTVHALWYVHDPVQVVLTQTAYGWDVVRTDLEQRLRELQADYAAAARHLDAAEITRHLAVTREIGDRGLAYRVIDVRTRAGDSEVLLAPSGGGGFPSAWSANSREEYDFCLYALRRGPVSLAALWLSRQPDQVKDVLDWTVHNRALLKEKSGWQDDMAGLLGALSEEERRELAKLLRDRLVSLGRGMPVEEEPPPDWNGWESGDGHP
ncbi:hypothetical protein [Streptomyces johnsoniae]|uniref:Transcriptional regulator n=1 Tax=Streptomyces johnsoniae TaxID=3075532 RepID=A0ABU2SGQ0_9ACTN|nr:hypothetical protein [Streptomyces sp. DSM 41886]MDT0447059.1 hypothetical protein [Streptomyces sp. DSM 41886]